MKKLIAAFAAGLVALSLGACSSAQQQTAQQVLAKLQTGVADGCSIFTAAESGVQVFIAADPTANQVVTVINLFCTANSTVNPASIQTFVSTSIPAAITAVNNSTVIPADKKPIVTAALTALNTALATALVIYNQNAPAALATAAMAQ